ncbi:MAG: PDZ domain-containing protein [Bacillota bacterium]|nr:PDZ domain-containing protein [Bacillota bacterium]
MMESLLELGRIFLTTFALALVMPIFWLVLLLVYLQYRRLASMEEKLFGRTINPIGRQMITSLGFGSLGGFAASITLVLLGLSLEQIGLYFLWPVALLLLLINPRYLCFSYAGGIVAAFVLLFRHILVPLFPAVAENFIIDNLLMIHIPALLVLIGLLHLVEALLIYVSGHKGSSPVYLKQSDGKVVGGHMLQRLWPVPLVALLVAVVPEVDIVGVSMPDWWPIIQSTLQPGTGESLQYMIIPVAAGLGYADVALSSTPREKTSSSAVWLALYSIILLFLAVGSEYYSFLVLPGVIFAPLGHELLILYGNRKEKNRPLLYRERPNGVAVMMVLPASAADDAGLQEGDLIVKINGQQVTGNLDMLQKIDDSYFMIFIEGERKGEPFSVVLKKRPSPARGGLLTGNSERNREPFKHPLLHRCAALGLIPVPPADSKVFLVMKQGSSSKWLRKWKKRIFK